MEQNLMTSLSNKKKNVIFAGVLITVLLSSIDTTIVGTIMPKIVAELNGFSIYSWVFSIYMLSIVLSLSVLGKITDLYGRKYLYMAGIVLFTISSVLCGVAHNMELLIVFRGIQGIGGGLLTGISPTIIGDIFSPAERPKYQGFLGGAFGLATIIGPILGGALSDAFSWRLAFLINIPIGLGALLIISKNLPNFNTRAGKKSVDIKGCIILLITILTFLFTLNLAGEKYNWASPVIIGLFVAVVALIILFVFVEKRTKEAIIPTNIFSYSVFNVTAIIGIILGVLMYASTLFLPLYFQGVMGYSSAKSGVIMLPMTISLVAGNIVSGIIVSKTGRYKFVSIFSFVVMILGAAVFVLNKDFENLAYVILGSCLLGVGMGISFPTFMNIAQNAVPYEYLGVVSSTTQFSRNLGGIIGVSVLSSVMNSLIWNRMDIQIYNATNNHYDIKSLFNIQLLLDGSRIGKLEESMKSIKALLPSSITEGFSELLKNALGSSLQVVFGIMAVSSVFCLIFIILFLKEIPLRGKKDIKQEGGELNEKCY